MDDDSDCSSLSSAPASPLAPPGFYPSPPPSQDADEPSAARSQDDLPPARKKRRVAAPKERRTQHLDLSATAGLSYTEQQSQIDYLVKTIQRHRKIVVIAGAGISTSAGSMLSQTPTPNPVTTTRLSVLTSFPSYFLIHYSS